MKKLLLSVLALILSVSIYAQDEATTNSSDKTISFGAKAGVNFATLSKDEGFKPDGLTSFHVGAVAEIPIVGDFLLQPEIVYSSQGFSVKEGGVTYKGKINYINVPVMAGYRIIEGLTAHLGPQVGILVSAKETNDVNDDKEDFQDDVTSVDIGVGVGAQYELDFGLFFQARYTLGLNKVFDYNNANDHQNRVASLSVGYFFN